MPIKPDLIRNVIAVAEAQTRGIRAPVTHIAMIGRGAFGPIFADPVELSDEQAPLIEKIGEGVPTAQGVETVSRTKLTFFYPLTVTESDRFIVDEVGGELPIARVRALLDPDKQPYMIEVWLGEGPSGG